MSTSGLHRLAAHTQALASHLSAAAAAEPLAPATWQANAGVVNAACVASRTDLAVMTARMGASAAGFNSAAAAYTAHEDASVRALHGLVS
ncbi:MAG: hypothetical protein F6Q13_15280 [Mycobacterium sp.]|nr:MAG: hypothetical protein F6Q13_15250 [Mycobacterium sp.]KAA8958684.1 MAG: hypothetical protein F6Q13_15280 [Mycobacterium sp.]